MPLCAAVTCSALRRQPQTVHNFHLIHSADLAVANAQSANSQHTGANKPPAPELRPDVILAVGKVTDTQYALHVRYPLSPLQAFAIFLAAWGREQD